MADRPRADRNVNFQSAWHTLVALSGPKPRMPSLPVDWDLVIDLADNQKSVLLLARGIAASAPSLIPGGPGLRLKELAKERGSKALMLARETAVLEAGLGNAVIATAVMKGSPLSWIVHGGLAVRDPGDIDLLIPAGKANDAASLLERNGYSSEFRQLLENSRQSERLMRVTNQMAFWNDATSIAVELHWRWQKFEGMMPTSPDRVWDRSMSIPGLGKASVPDGVEHFIYLCAHGLAHGWSRLKWLNDIRWILHNGSLVENDWDAVVARPEEIGMATAVATATLAAAKIDDVVLPEPLNNLVHRVPDCETYAAQSLDQMLEQAAHWKGRPVSSNPIAIARRLLNHIKLSITDRSGSRITRLRALFLPSPQELSMIDLPRGFGLAYLVIRAGRMFPRFFKAREVK